MGQPLLNNVFASLPEEIAAHTNRLVIVGQRQAIGGFERMESKLVTKL